VTSWTVQLITLLSVAVGALASFVSTRLVDRSRWRREESLRWDSKRLECYGEFSVNVSMTDRCERQRELLDPEWTRPRPAVLHVTARSLVTGRPPKHGLGRLGRVRAVASSSSATGKTPAAGVCRHPPVLSISIAASSPGSIASRDIPTRLRMSLCSASVATAGGHCSGIRCRNRAVRAGGERPGSVTRVWPRRTASSSSPGKAETGDRRTTGASRTGRDRPALRRPPRALPGSAPAGLLPAGRREG
jgi:hypothetical protein